MLRLLHVSFDYSSRSCAYEYLVYLVRKQDIPHNCTVEIGLHKTSNECELWKTSSDIFMGAKDYGFWVTVAHDARRGHPFITATYATLSSLFIRSSIDTSCYLVSIICSN